MTAVNLPPLPKAAFVSYLGRGKYELLSNAQVSAYATVTAEAHAAALAERVRVLEAALRHCADHLAGPTAWTQEQETWLVDEVHAALKGTP